MILLDLHMIHVKLSEAFSSSKSVVYLQGLLPQLKAMPMALCQIVAHEVKLENIRRKDKVSVTCCLENL